jgi:hypothetical protein
VKKSLNLSGLLINILNLSWYYFTAPDYFQIPIIQILIGLLNIVSPQQMLGADI